MPLVDLLDIFCTAASRRLDPDQMRVQKTERRLHMGMDAGSFIDIYQTKKAAVPLSFNYYCDCKQQKHDRQRTCGSCMRWPMPV
jgi:hypothetical protein